MDKALLRLRGGHAYIDYLYKIGVFEYAVAEEDILGPELKTTELVIPGVRVVISDNGDGIYTVSATSETEPGYGRVNLNLLVNQLALGDNVWFAIRFKASDLGNYVRLYNNNNGFGKLSPTFTDVFEDYLAPWENSNITSDYLQLYVEPGTTLTFDLNYLSIREVLVPAGQVYLKNRGASNELNDGLANAGKFKWQDGLTNYAPVVLDTTFGANLYTNGDNESSVWQLSNILKLTSEQSVEQVHSGTFSCKFISTEDGTAYALHDLNATELKSYYIEIYVYIPSGQTTLDTLTLSSQGVLLESRATVHGGVTSTTVKDQWVRLWAYYTPNSLIYDRPGIRAENTVIGEYFYTDDAFVTTVDVVSDAVVYFSYEQNKFIEVVKEEFNLVVGENGDMAHGITETFCHAFTVPTRLTDAELAYGNLHREAFLEYRLGGSEHIEEFSFSAEDMSPFYPAWENGPYLQDISVTPTSLLEDGFGEFDSGVEGFQGYLNTTTTSPNGEVVITYTGDGSAQGYAAMKPWSTGAINMAEHEGKLAIFKIVMKASNPTLVIPYFIWGTDNNSSTEIDDQGGMSTEYKTFYRIAHVPADGYNWYFRGGFNIGANNGDTITVASYSIDFIAATKINAFTELVDQLSNVARGPSQFPFDQDVTGKPIGFDRKIMHFNNNDGRNFKTNWKAPAADFVIEFIHHVGFDGKQSFHGSYTGDSANMYFGTGADNKFYAVIGNGNVGSLDYPVSVPGYYFGAIKYVHATGDTYISIDGGPFAIVKTGAIKTETLVRLTLGQRSVYGTPEISGQHVAKLRVIIDPKKIASYDETASFDEWLLDGGRYLANDNDELIVDSIGQYIIVE